MEQDETSELCGDDEIVAIVKEKKKKDERYQRMKGWKITEKISNRKGLTVETDFVM